MKKREKNSGMVNLSFHNERLFLFHFSYKADKCSNINQY